MTVSLPLRQARRIALGAQGLVAPRPTRPVSAGRVGRTFARLQLLQIDSMNVLARSHYLPLFSRLGPYDEAVLDRMGQAAPRTMIEYWAHEASYVRPELFSDLRAWQRRTWPTAAGLDPVVVDGLTDRILALLATGPGRTARELSQLLGHEEEAGRSHWGWNWNAVKRVLEHLFADGRVAAAGRTRQFERLYALTEHVHPQGAAALEPADPREALARLTLEAARAAGIATAGGLADYFRLPVRQVAAAAGALVRDGALEQVRVPGWTEGAFLDPEAVRPRRAAGRALLSPFDSMVFERRRLEELFGFRYRLEVYTPAPARTYGYYVLPFLLGDQFVARVDLKADRQQKLLLVQAAHAEPGAPSHTAAELSRELSLLAGWLGLEGVMVRPAGNLADPLKLAVHRE